jgi:glycosyltransferase involved in cell wall biosynthesis
LVEALKKLADYPKAFFVVGGSGTHFDFLNKTLQNNQMKNVLLYSWLPSKDYEMILRISDVGLIFLDKAYTTPQFPSRLLSYINVGKPLLCAINQATDIGSIVEESGSGKSVIHGDMDSFIKEVIFFSENESERYRMGLNARRLLLENYTTKIGYDIIVNHFHSLNYEQRNHNT